MAYQSEARLPPLVETGGSSAVHYRNPVLFYSIQTLLASVACVRVLRSAQELRYRYYYCYYANYESIWHAPNDSFRARRAD